MVIINVIHKYSGSPPKGMVELQVPGFFIVKLDHRTRISQVTCFLLVGSFKSQCMIYLSFYVMCNIQYGSCASSLHPRMRIWSRVASSPMIDTLA